MIIKDFKVSDDAYAKYKSYNSKDVEGQLATQLVRFQDVKPSSRIVVIPESHRQELEVLLDRFLDSPDDVVSQIKRCLTIKVSDVEVSLTPDQLERIKLTAEFEGKPFKPFLQEKITEAIKLTLDGYL